MVWPVSSDEWKAPLGSPIGFGGCVITGLGKNLDRDDRIEGPIGDPSINDTLSS